MGAFAGAGLLAMAGAFIASQIYGNFEGAAAMAGLWLGAFAGAIIGLAIGLWLVLRHGGENGPIAALSLTGFAVLMVACFVIAAFSD
jgi:hypothetical protein